MPIRLTPRQLSNWLARSWLMTALCAASIHAAVAGTLDVNPTRIDFALGKTTAAINVSNPGTSDIVVQARITAWSQIDGIDHYDATQDLLVTPPLMTIKPGDRQFVRIALRKPAAARDEKTYRLFFEEVPMAQTGSPTLGLNVALRVGIPVFVAPQELQAAPQISWTLEPNASGDHRVVLRNSGNGHIRITALSLQAAGVAPIPVFAGLLYVLPGQSWRGEVKSRTLDDAQRRDWKALIDSDAGQLEPPITAADR